MLLLIMVLPIRGRGGPVRSVAQQINDHNAEVMIGVHQPGGRRDNAVTIGIRVIGGAAPEKAPAPVGSSCFDARIILTCRIK
jgi:hypothetical protein